MDGEAPGGEVESLGDEWDENTDGGGDGDEDDDKVLREMWVCALCGEDRKFLQVVALCRSRHHNPKINTHCPLCLIHLETSTQNKVLLAVPLN